MQKWEYLHVSIDTVRYAGLATVRANNHTWQAHLDKFTQWDEMNSFGKQGWELVQGNGSEQNPYIFKRPLR